MSRRRRRRRGGDSDEPKAPAGMASPSAALFAAQFTSSGPSFDTLDAKVQQLIIDTGLEITDKEELAALNEISGPAKIELFERIAKGMSKKAALLEVIQLLIVQRRDRKKAEQGRRIDYEQKLVDFKEWDLFLRAKMKIANRLFGEMKKMSRSEKNTPKNKKKMELLELIRPKGVELEPKLAALQKRAKGILECNSERTLRRLRRREKKEKAAFELGMDEMKQLLREYMLVDNPPEFLHTGVFALEDDEAKAERERLRLEHEKMMALLAEQRRQKEFRDKVKIIDGYRSKLAESILDAMTDMTLLRKRKEVLTKMLAEEEAGLDDPVHPGHKKPIDEEKIQLIKENLDLIDRELVVGQGIIDQATLGCEKLDEVRKTRYEILNAADEARRRQLEAKELEQMLDAEDVRKDVGVRQYKFEQMEDRRAHLEALLDAHYPKFGNYTDFAREKLAGLEKAVRNRSELMEAMIGGIDPSAYEDEEDRIAYALKKKMLEREIDFVNKMKMRTEAFENDVADMKNDCMTDWLDGSEALEMLGGQCCGMKTGILDKQLARLKGDQRKKLGMETVAVYEIPAADRGKEEEVQMCIEGLEGATLLPGSEDGKVRVLLQQAELMPRELIDKVHDSTGVLLKLLGQETSCELMYDDPADLGQLMGFFTGTEGLSLISLEEELQSVKISFDPEHIDSSTALMERVKTDLNVELGFPGTGTFKIPKTPSFEMNLNRIHEAIRDTPELKGLLVTDKDVMNGSIDCRYRTNKFTPASIFAAIEKATRLPMKELDEASFKVMDPEKVDAAAEFFMDLIGKYQANAILAADPDEATFRISYIKDQCTPKSIVEQARERDIPLIHLRDLREEPFLLQSGIDDLPRLMEYCENSPVLELVGVEEDKLLVNICFPSEGMHPLSVVDLVKKDENIDLVWMEYGDLNYDDLTDPGVLPKIKEWLAENVPDLVISEEDPVKKNLHVCYPEDLDINEIAARMRDALDCHVDVMSGEGIDAEDVVGLREVEKQLETQGRELMEMIKEHTQDAGSRFQGLMNQYQALLDDERADLEDMIDDCPTLTDEEKGLRKDELRKQFGIFKDIADFIDDIRERVAADRANKVKLLKDLEEELKNPELGDLERAQLEKKKAEVEEAMGKLDEISELVDEFENAFQKLKAVSLAMLVCDNKQAFLRLKKEKAKLMDDFDDVSERLNDAIEAYGLFDKDDLAKRDQLRKRRDQLKACMKKIDERTAAFDLDEDELTALIKEVDEKLSSGNFTDEEVSELEGHKKRLEAELAECLSLRDRYGALKDMAKDLEAKAFSCYFIKDPMLLDELDRETERGLAELKSKLAELDEAVREYEEASLGRIARRNRRLARRNRFRDAEEAARRAMILQMIEQIKRIDERLRNETDPDVKRMLLAKRKALIETIKRLGGQDLLDEFGIPSTAAMLSALRERQKKLRMMFTSVMEDADNLVKAKPLSAIDKKILAFRKKVMGQRDKLEIFLDRKREEIHGLTDRIEDPEESAKNKALLSFEKECRLIQETAIEDCMAVFDDFILNAGKLVKDQEMEDAVKARKLKNYHDKLRRAQAAMKEALARQEKRIKQKQEEFRFRREEEFEIEEEHFMNIVDLKTTFFLNRQYRVYKRDPKKKLDRLFTAMKGKLYEVDFMHSRLKEMRTNGRLLLELQPDNILTVERYPDNLKGIRVLFMEMDKPYELICQSNEHREQLYSLLCSIRPFVYSFCPPLCPKNAKRSRTTIRGFYPKPKGYLENPSNPNPNIEGEFRLKVTSKPTEELLIWCGTWNVGGEKPPKNLIKKVMPLDRKFDVYVLGLQNAPFRKAVLLKNYFAEVIRPRGAREAQEFMVVNAEAIHRTQIVVLCNITTGMKVADVKTSSVNFKRSRLGSVAVNVSINETNLLFLTSHFEPDKRQVRNELRMANYDATVRGLSHGVEKLDFMSQFDYVFWMGDFHYNMPRDVDTLQMMADPEIGIEKVFEYDSLNAERKAGHVFQGFEEAPVDFNPTYPYKRQDAPELVDDVKRLGRPSWRDRIFYRQLTSTQVCEPLYYRTSPMCIISEHLCTCALFKIKSLVPFNMIYAKPRRRFDVEFLRLRLDVDASMMSSAPQISRPKAFFYAPFWESHGASKVCQQRNVCNPSWIQGQLPTMVTGIPRDMLAQQKVIVAVRDGNKETTASDEFRNLMVSAVVELQGAVDAMEYYGTYSFEVPAHTFGRVIGKFVGEVFVRFHVEKRASAVEEGGALHAVRAEVRRDDEEEEGE